MAQSGSAPGREPGGRRFKSCFSDHFRSAWGSVRQTPPEPIPSEVDHRPLSRCPEGSRGTAPRWYRGHGGFDSRSGLQSQECDDLLEDACGVRGGDCSNLSRPPHNNRPVDDGDHPALCGGQSKAASHRHRTPFVPCGSERTEETPNRWRELKRSESVHRTPFLASGVAQRQSTPLLTERVQVRLLPPERRRAVSSTGEHLPYKQETGARLPDCLPFPGSGPVGLRQQAVSPWEQVPKLTW